MSSDHEPSAQVCREITDAALADLAPTWRPSPSERLALDCLSRAAYRMYVLRRVRGSELPPLSEAPATLERILGNFTRSAPEWQALADLRVRAAADDQPCPVTLLLRPFCRAALAPAIGAS